MQGESARARKPEGGGVVCTHSVSLSFRAGVKKLLSENRCVHDMARQTKRGGGGGCGGA